MTPGKQRTDRERISRRGYPIPVITKARKHHEAGWKPRAIQRLLADEMGVTPSEKTIRRWVIPREAATARRAMRAAHKARTERRRLAKMVEMREAGMSLSGIVIAASIFLGLEVTEEQVRYRLIRRGESA